MKLVLDTSGYICCEQLHAKGLRLLEQADRLYLPMIALGELLLGFRAGTRYLENRKRLESFLETYQVEIIEIDVKITEKYAILGDILRRKGRPIPTHDLWISACCLHVNGTLLTADRHFLEIEGLHIELLNR